MRSSVLLPMGVLLTALAVFACTDTPAEPTQETAALTADGQPTSPTFDSKRVIHRVSVAGADVCEATGRPTGCDANFSLVAYQRADGSVGGQWQDTFDGGRMGIHVAVDCLNVVGNAAILGGVITHGTSEVSGEDVTGQRALTAVVDNGTSVKDPPDQIGYSVIGLGGPRSCRNATPPGIYQLEYLTHGQVKVW